MSCYRFNYTLLHVSSLFLRTGDFHTPIANPLRRKRRPGAARCLWRPAEPGRHAHTAHRYNARDQLGRNLVRGLGGTRARRGLHAAIQHVSLEPNTYVQLLVQLWYEHSLQLWHEHSTHELPDQLGRHEYLDQPGRHLTHEVTTTSLSIPTLCDSSFVTSCLMLPIKITSPGSYDLSLHQPANSSSIMLIPLTAPLALLLYCSVYI